MFNSLKTDIQLHYIFHNLTPNKLFQVVTLLTRSKRSQNIVQ
jgi:hypothetical protein